MNKVVNTILLKGILLIVRLKGKAFICELFEQLLVDLLDDLRDWNSNTFNPAEDNNPLLTAKNKEE